MILKPEVNNKCENAILVTGCARSGTTILGKVIHSMEKVEYAFEPPTVLALFSLINDLDRNHWKLLFNTYLYEDFFANALAGRNINLNEEDDSSIWKVKSKSEIETRLQDSVRKEELSRKLIDRQIAFKLPGILPYLNKFRQHYPDIKIVFMTRNPVDTINSLLEKEWFTDESLATKNLIWPCRRFDGKYIPHWVEPNMYMEWIKMTTIDRCGYYYLCNYSPPQDKNSITINYDYFVSNPEEIFDTLCTNLNLEKGKKTDQILKSVEKKNRKQDKDILNKISAGIADKLKKAQSEISEITIL